MTEAEALTIWDFWPLGVLAVLLIFAVVAVTRGLGRKPDSSANSARGGGADFRGKGGRW